MSEDLKTWRDRDDTWVIKYEGHVRTATDTEAHLLARIESLVSANYRLIERHANEIADKNGEIRKLRERIQELDDFATRLSRRIMEREMMD